MESPSGGNDENWLKDYIKSAVAEMKHAESTTSATPVSPAWMERIDGPSPRESMGPIGPYRIAKRLGRGGMGVVFEAFDSTLRRVVAIKFLSPRLAVSSLARARFSREAQAAAAINHPNVVTIHAIGEHEGLPYLVMEYVAGITLADRLNQDGILQLKSILRIGIQIASGLEAAHSQGLVHRDIKPANILLERGIDRVKITDFGLACVTAEPWRLTASGVLLGTPPYMSPEQAVGGALDHRSDLFSLGSVLYQLCTGEPPFPGPSVMAILTGVREREPRPIRDLNPDIPRALEQHIRRLMAKNPADRFASAHELVRTLLDYLAETQGRKPDESLDDPLREFRDAEPVPTEDRERKFEIVDSWDELSPLPWPRHASRGWRIAERRNVVKVAGIVTAVALTAIAIASALPRLWQTFGQDTPIMLLLVLAGLAVFTWSLSRLLTAVSRERTAEPPKRRTKALMRNSVATVILLLVAGAAYLDWSAHAQARLALAAIRARAQDPRHGLTRRQVEALIGRSADGPSTIDKTGTLRAFYRWKGVFRTEVLAAEYQRMDNSWKSSATTTSSEPDAGSDVLIWINGDLE
jgi:serine/threonine protein kinase